MFLYVYDKVAQRDLSTLYLTSRATRIIAVNELPYNVPTTESSFELSRQMDRTLSKMVRGESIDSDKEK